MNESYNIEHVSWNEAREALSEVRHRVFIQEQNVPESLEWDEADAHCIHVLARDDQARPIGCARLLEDGQIGRMAVIESWRGRGVGAALLRTLLERAKEAGLHAVFLHAQTQAIGFYERLGFTAQGEVFMEADIPHRYMHRRLDS